MTTTHQIENKYYAIEIARESGRLLQLRDKVGGFDLIREPRLAENFRLLLPLPDMAANYILGSEQKLSFFGRKKNAFELRWASPLHNERGQFALAVTLWIELIGEAVHFRCRVRNGTRHKLAEVWYPVIGGMMGLGRGLEGKETEALVPTPNNHWRRKLFSDFGNTHGQMLGTLSGEHGFCYPGFMSMPWICFWHQQLNRGLYFASLETAPRVRLIRFAQEPGLAEGRAGGNWPRPDEVGDIPTGISMNWAHFPYTKPGATFEGSTVVLQCHEGGWRESAALYGGWFRSQFPVVDSRKTWLRRETAFLHPMCMLPEDNMNMPFRELPRWAKTAASHGLTSICIGGWNVGGHDRGYPHYEPDPRLGTWKELAEGIRACHDMGLRFYFFANCQPVDMTTEWYRKELYKYRLEDPYGQPYFIVNFWGMGTLGARTRFCTARPIGEMNPHHPEVRRLLIRQFCKLVEIGADGIHLDKFQGTPFDFNPRLKGTSPDRAHPEGMLMFIRELLTACRKINPEFCFSFEGGWDRLLSFTDVSWWGPADDVMKEIFPHRVLTAGVEQPYDFNKVNRAVLKGCNLLIGPANYNRAMDYPPMQKLCEYVGEITRIRRELFDFLSFGGISDASDGLFQRSQPLVSLSLSRAAKAHCQWTVFRNPDSGQRAIVVANLGTSELEAKRISYSDNTKGACHIYEPFHATRSAEFPVTLTLPPERLSVIVEI